MSMLSRLQQHGLLPVRLLCGDKAEPWFHPPCALVSSLSGNSAISKFAVSLPLRAALANTHVASGSEGWAWSPPLLISALCISPPSEYLIARF